MKEWAADDQPREKLMREGAHSLSVAELLAILIHNGTRDASALDVAKNMLLYANNDLQQLARMSVQELIKSKIRGIGEAKSVTIAAAMELGVRRKAAEHFRTKIQGSKDIAGYLQARLEYRKQEVFAVVYLNRGNRILSLETISEGGLTGTVADPRIILKKALEQDATSLVLCHNHPSGNLQPSEADRVMTRRIKEALKLFDVALLDHVIVTREGYFSFAERGERSLSGMAGADSKLEQKLREEILRQLKKVTSANAPNLFEMMQSPKGYEQVEQLVINKVLHDQMVPAAVIPLLETELEMV